MKKRLKRIAYRSAAVAAWLVKLTCRIRMNVDPRPDLKKAGIPHVIAVLHGQQLAALMAGEKGSHIMVSKSEDGEIVIPTLEIFGHVAVRGSAGSRKGGAVALKTIVNAVRTGDAGALSVDGPRGPRGSVHGGIGVLAKKSGAVVVVAIVVPRRRWILSRTWDRLQIPKPFTRIDVHCSLPLSQAKGESLSAFVKRIEHKMAELEWEHDPEEARVTRPPIAPAESKQAA